jgi:peptide/nickel transport system substrate-binding protein
LHIPAWSAIIPPEAVANIRNNPVGTGPFRFVSQVPKTSLTLEKFPDFWQRPLPYLDGLRYQVIPDENALLAALQSKQVDFITTVPLVQAKQIAGNRDLKLITFKSSWVDELGLNVRRKPFNDPRVRRAVSLALNRNEIAKAATYGLGGSAKTMVAPASPVNIRVQNLPYDPKTAKKLLAQAGYPNGFSLKFSACVGTAYPQMLRAGEVIANQLRAVGIRATFATQEAGLFNDAVVTKHDFDAFVCGLVSGLDPDGHSYAFFTSKGIFNFSGYSNPKVDALLNSGRIARGTAKRSVIYSKAWRIILKDIPWIPLYWVPGVFASLATVQGFQPLPEFNVRMDTVWLSG